MDDKGRLLSAFFTSDDPSAIRAAAAQVVAASAGVIRSPGTLILRTGKPERDGLYCAKVFGPVEDLRCLCGAIHGAARGGEICERCGVLCGESSLRSERWAHIESPAPLIHPRLLPLVAERLGLRPAQVLRVLSRRANLNADGSLTSAKRGEGGMYAFEDPSEEEKDARGPWFLQRALGADRDLLVEAIPITPPAWRAVSSADTAGYQRVVTRAARLARLIELHAPSIILENEEKMLQHVFDRLCSTMRAELSARASHGAASHDTSRSAALLAAVYAQPDAMDRRAVYADYLNEVGDPRGEFIALQLANADKPRMSPRESQLLRRHLGEWIAPIEELLDERPVFRGGFMARCRTKKGAELEALIGHPVWSTAEHLETEEPRLITHPSMVCLRSLGLTFTTLRQLCEAGAPLPKIEALTVRLSGCPPKLHAMVTSSAILPSLRALTMIHKTIGGGQDWRWLDGARLLEKVGDITVVTDHERHGPATLTFWAAQLLRLTALERVTISIGMKHVLYELRRAVKGVELDVRLSDAGLERAFLAQDDPYVVNGMESAVTGIAGELVALRVEVPPMGWNLEPLVAWIEKLRARHPQAALPLPPPSEPEP